MKDIFIDTNVYLRLYDRKNDARFDVEFIDLLVNIKDRIFITKQMVDEIDRNKIKAFSDIFNQYIKNCKIDKVDIPDYMNYKKIKEYNNELEKIKGQVSNIKSSLENIKKEIISDMLNSKDLISKKLKPILDNCVAPDEDIINKAKLRKKLGNPPGKKQDPVGDELNWEQYLSYLKENKKSINNITIISKDKDFFQQEVEPNVLNLYLKKEIDEIFKDGIEVKCYSKLKDFITDNNIGKVPSELLNKIKKEEEIEEKNDKPYIFYKFPYDPETLSRLLNYAVNGLNNNNIYYDNMKFND